MSLRVVQFSTGNVGRPALQAIIEHPDLELVGVHAASSAKIGKDAAELCGLDTPTGVIATDDVDALVALGADCLLYTTQGESRPQEALAELTKFLEAGTNVVSTALVWMIYPPNADAWLRDPLAAACAQGGSTMFVGGIDPGYSGDTLPFAALSLCTRADHILVQEICDYGSHDDAEFTGASMGFGASPDATPLMAIPGVLTSIWGGLVHLLADELGVEVDEIRERYEMWATPEPIDCAMMRVEPGGVAAVRFAVDGVVGGEVRIVMEHVNRLGPDAAPDWPQAPERRPTTHRVVVQGEPGVEVNTHVGRPGLDHNVAGCIATAARVVNAIPAVCAAAPGLISTRDLPISLVRGLMR
ncbi:MAG: dihydrodipicolinate reductase [Acidimicrobiia bacterium]